ncbi:hypothetical protein IGI04_003484, partial [Brassica rapa subsp. trilocularis]
MSYLPPVWTLANYANTFPAAHTGVFWDINDFPLPCLDPHVVYENINSTLLNKETRDYRMTVEMLICALDHPISNLMVLAEDFKEEDAVDNIYLLHHRQQNIFLAYKQQAGSILVPKTHGGFMKLTTTIIIFNSPTLGSFPRSS